MGMAWLKLHHDIIHDIKLRRFTAQEKWAWIVLLVLASESGDRGIITADDEDIADFCEFNSKQDWLYFRDKLISKGMLEHQLGGLKLLNWEKRQHIKPSDKPEATRERKRKQRALQKEKIEAMSRDVTPMSRGSHATDTDPDPDPDSDTEGDLRERERSKTGARKNLKSTQPDPEIRNPESLSPVKNSSEELEIQQATALDLDYPPNSAPPPQASPAKTPRQGAGITPNEHPYPAMVEQGLGTLWTGANQTGVNRLRSFDEVLVEGVIQHLTKYDLPNQRGDAISCILNTIYRGEWGKLAGWFEGAKPVVSGVDAADMLQRRIKKARELESAKRRWVGSLIESGTTRHIAYREWDELPSAQQWEIVKSFREEEVSK